MLAALARGKPPFDTSSFSIEDLLTSTVFGACRYVPPDRALDPFLGRAINESGDRLASRLVGVLHVEYAFWP